MDSLEASIPSAMLTALAGAFHPVLLTYADHPDGEQFVHSNFGEISFDGETWLGLGPYASYSASAEGVGLESPEGEIHLAASLSDILAERDKQIRGRSIKIYMGCTTTAGGNVLVADPIVLFDGYFDGRGGASGRSGDDLTHDMTLKFNSGPSPRAGAAITHSYEDQIAKYPGDTGGRQLQNAIKNRINPKV